MVSFAVMLYLPVCMPLLVYTTLPVAGPASTVPFSSISTLSVTILAAAVMLTCVFGKAGSGFIASKGAPVVLVVLLYFATVPDNAPDVSIDAVTLPTSAISLLNACWLYLM